VCLGRERSTVGTEILAPNIALCSSKLATMPEPHSASSAAIELRSVSRQYQMGETVVRAVDQVSFAIPRGDFAALLGPSGSGKSTLLNLIAGLDRPTSGAIVVDGRDLATMSSEELARYRRNTVGMIFQSFNLVPTMTLAENVELPMRFAEVDRAERAQRAIELLTKVGLASRADHRPSQLSGGEQQRGAIARALVNRPTLLLADEPTGNLDSRTGQEIMDLIVELNSTLGVTIVMVTHEQALADHYSRRALHMADGKLANVIEEVKL
jgi:ABC-type lipoprotein export system ATPase subunit